MCQDVRHAAASLREGYPHIAGTADVELNNAQPPAPIAVVGIAGLTGSWWPLITLPLAVAAVGGDDVTGRDVVDGIVGSGIGVRHKLTVTDASVWPAKTGVLLRWRR